MRAEYFPPREEIILFNEAPSEFYIVVNGQAVSAAHAHALMTDFYSGKFGRGVCFGRVRFLLTFFRFGGRLQDVLTTKDASEQVKMLLGHIFVFWMHFGTHVGRNF